MNKTICFISYLNRSGSTLLAKKLNEFKDIAVGIEFKLSSDIKEHFYAITEKELDYWLDKIYLDKKFQAWDVDRSELKNYLLKLNKTIRFNDFLKTALALHFKNDPAKFLIHKSRYYLGKLDKVEELFPGSKHIFVDRDPRAIFNSQKKSIDSTTGKIMQNNIVRFALNYKTNQKRINFYLKSKFFKNKILKLRYEELLKNEEVEIKKVINFLNVSENKKTHNNYFNRIPHTQKHLHSNLLKGNIENRIDAWKNELPTYEINFLNIVLRKELVKNKYDKNNKKIYQNLLNMDFLKIVIVFCLKFYFKHFIKIMLVNLKLRKIY